MHVSAMAQEPGKRVFLIHGEKLRAEHTVLQRKLVQKFPTIVQCRPSFSGCQDAHAEDAEDAKTPMLRKPRMPRHT